MLRILITAILFSGLIAHADPVASISSNLAGDSAWTWDGSAWVVKSLGAIGANPTGTIGLSTVNGAAATFLRSDGAPPLSQTITPTWTNIHTYSASSFGSSSAIQMASALPSLLWKETDQAANGQKYGMSCEGRFWSFERYNDNDGTATQLFTVQGSVGSANTTAIAIGNASSNPTLNLNGTGLVTIGGSVDAVGNRNGLTNTLGIRNQSNTASSQARNYVEVAGTSAGNPYSVWSIGSEGATAAMSIGLKNDASDSATFTYGVDLATNKVFQYVSTAFRLWVPLFFKSLLISGAAPTISSGFGTSPSIASNNGTAAFTVDVGTGGAASTGVIGLPTATTGWNCFCNDITTYSATVYMCRQTASSTTSASIGQFTPAAVAQAWVASDILRVSCFAY